MIASGTLAQARLNPVRRDSGPFRGSGYYLLASTPCAESLLAPQAFLVQQDANWNFQSHFHLTAQFQVVVGGDGTLGRHEIKPVTVHYAAPQSGYGPLIAGSEGLSYMTIRAQADTGMWCLPDEKDRMDHPMTRFHGWSEHIPVLEPAALRELKTAASAVVMPHVADGSSATVVTLPPRAAHTPPRGPDGGHEFYLVLSGDIVFDGKTLSQHDVGFASADAAAHFTAGADGAQVLILSFGRAALLSPHPVKEPSVAAA